MKTLVVVPWHNRDQINQFLDHWRVTSSDPRLLLVKDENGDGCAVTKNRGIQAAMQAGADVVIIVDSDCYPDDWIGLEWFIDCHLRSLEPKAVSMFKDVTDPPSRGSPYQERSMVMPVAASMGFWNGVPDFDAVTQLAHRNGPPIEFHQEPIYGRYFPLCGMNLAFRPARWMPWCQFIDVPRFDDIWMGWLFQKEAYRRGYCFSLEGPFVNHSRQSNVWRNLTEEAKHLERSDSLWLDIARSDATDYESLRKLLPV